MEKDTSSPMESQVSNIFIFIPNIFLCVCMRANSDKFPNCIQCHSPKQRKEHVVYNTGLKSQHTIILDPFHIKNHMVGRCPYWNCPHNSTVAWREYAYPSVIGLPHIINPVQPMTMKTYCDHFSPWKELVSHIHTCHQKSKFNTNLYLFFFKL